MTKYTDYFIENYLTPGQTYDNYVFNSCPEELMTLAKESLSKTNNQAKPCNICISKEDEEKFENTVSLCKKDNQKDILARDYFCSLFLMELVKYLPNQSEYQQLLSEGINTILSGDFEKAKVYHSFAPLPHDVLGMIKKIGKIELNIFLDNTKNVNIQRVINSYLSSRNSFSIKVFANFQKFSTFLDLGNNCTVIPHDYMLIDSTKYIKDDKKEELEI